MKLSTVWIPSILATCSVILRTSAIFLKDFLPSRSCCSANFIGRLNNLLDRGRAAAARTAATLLAMAVTGLSASFPAGVNEQSSAEKQREGDKKGGDEQVHGTTPLASQPKSSKWIFSRSTPRSSSIFMTEKSIIGGPHT